MTKTDINSLSPQASRLLTTVALAIEFRRRTDVYILDVHVVRRARLTWTELKLALNDLRSAGFLLTRQGKFGVTYAVPVGALPTVWKAE